MRFQTRERSRAPLLWLMAALLLLANLAQPAARAPGLSLGDWRLSGATTVAAAELTEAQRAFAALQGRATGPLSANWDPALGIPDFLAGADAATPLPYTPTAAERGNPAAIARGFLDANRALFRLTGVAADLVAAPLEPDAQLGYSQIRLRQVYQGLPVFGKELIVHIDPHERVLAVNGHFLPAIDVPTAPAIDRARAEQAALDDLLGAQLDPDERATVATDVRRDKTSLVVYVDTAGKATLTWQLTILTTAPLGEWRFFVNARRPVVTARFDNAAEGKQRRTYTANNSNDIPGRLVVQEGERSRDDIAQAAHDGAGKVYDYYANVHKRDGVDGRGSPMISTVHYGSSQAEAENAAWIGEAGQMVYGDGGRTFKPLAYGLDVIGHEFTHGVIQSTADLTYQGQSGALNESYADIFGVLIAGTDWTIGGSVVKSPPFPLPYLRSLADPNANGQYDPRNPLRGVGQPATVQQYANLPLSRRSDNGGVHINSGIPNHTAYLMAQALGNDKTGQICFRALTQYLTPDATFLDAARASVRAAQELYGQGDADAVARAFGQVGLDVSGGTGAPPAPPASPPPPPAQPGPGSPGSPAPVPSGCRDLVTNGGFESTTGWTQRSATDTPIIDPELPHSGSRSAWLGGTDEEAVQYIFQDIAIPANATNVRLTYYRFLHQEKSGFLGGLAGDAQFSALIADTTGNVVAPIEQLRSSQGDDTWRQREVDLARFAGTTIRLTFHAQNPRNNVSSMFIDDVVLAACTGGTGPAAPPTTSQDQVYIGGRIADADTGRGVQGAQVFLLKPGISASRAAADNALSADEVLTTGTTDANGDYRLEMPVQRGRSYGVIVIAGGYRSIVADGGMSVPGNAPNPFIANAQLRRGR